MKNSTTSGNRFGKILISIAFWLLLWQVYFSILPVLRQTKRKQKIIPDTLIHSSVRPIMGIPFRGLVILSE